MTRNDRYWPNGFFADLITLFGDDSDEHRRPAELEEIARRAAEELATALVVDPRRVLITETGLRAAFEARLEARWGRALDLADLMVHEAYESGKWVNDSLRPAAATGSTEKFEVLVRLHARAVMTTREVLVLLRSGYSTAALARWRTLHEVRVVFLLLAAEGEQLSRRYLAHDNAERLRGQREYEGTWGTLGLEPPAWTVAEREDTKAQLAAEFGSEFLSDYGWAAEVINRAPRFKDLQRHVGLDDWRGYYRMASHGTHANPMGVTWNIQDLGDTNMAWAGPSNAGLVDPAQCSLIALTDITAGLLAYAVCELPDPVDPEILYSYGFAFVQRRKIEMLRDHAIETFGEAHNQQVAEEEALADLISRATAILQDGIASTIPDLAAELDIAAEDLQVALDAAVARGELCQESHYRLSQMEPASSPAPAIANAVRSLLAGLRRPLLRRS
ncbi:MAG: hypothetical protein F4Y18_04880 [Cenarchaeum sp. SB0663_bin_5]|nr:hypothetical protein [Cenarchaeum sp. SB0663_bin_5]MYH00942.1 hypothetical protein [Acidimicrobiaceae bacterium]MYL10607.1 hypothetical protein [Cenarchaeum sp. SB0669_bin_11]